MEFRVANDFQLQWAAEQGVYAQTHGGTLEQAKLEAARRMGEVLGSEWNQDELGAIVEKRWTEWIDSRFLGEKQVESKPPAPPQPKFLSNFPYPDLYLNGELLTGCSGPSDHRLWGVPEKSSNDMWLDIGPAAYEVSPTEPAKPIAWYACIPSGPEYCYYPPSFPAPAISAIPQVSCELSDGYTFTLDLSMPPLQAYNPIPSADTILNTTIPSADPIISTTLPSPIFKLNDRVKFRDLTGKIVHDGGFSAPDDWRWTVALDDPDTAWGTQAKFQSTEVQKSISNFSHRDSRTSYVLTTSAELQALPTTSQSFQVGDRVYDGAFGFGTVIGPYVHSYKSYQIAFDQPHKALGSAESSIPTEVHQQRQNFAKRYGLNPSETRFHTEPGWYLTSAQRPLPFTEVVPEAAKPLPPPEEKVDSYIQKIREEEAHSNFKVGDRVVFEGTIGTIIQDRGQKNSSGRWLIAFDGENLKFGVLASYFERPPYGIDSDPDTLSAIDNFKFKTLKTRYYERLSSQLKPSSATAYEPNARVFHPEYGFGTVVARWEGGADHLVVFDQEHSFLYGGLSLASADKSYFKTSCDYRAKYGLTPHSKREKSMVASNLSPAARPIPFQEAKQESKSLTDNLSEADASYLASRVQELLTDLNQFVAKDKYLNGSLDAHTEVQKDLDLLKSLASSADLHKPSTSKGSDEIAQSMSQIFSSEVPKSSTNSAKDLSDSEKAKLINRLGSLNLDDEIWKFKTETEQYLRWSPHKWNVIQTTLDLVEPRAKFGDNSRFFMAGLATLRSLIKAANRDVQDREKKDFLATFPYNPPSEINVIAEVVEALQELNIVSNGFITFKQQFMTIYNSWRSDEIPLMLRLLRGHQVAIDHPEGKQLVKQTVADLDVRKIDQGCKQLEEKLYKLGLKLEQEDVELEQQASQGLASIAGPSMPVNAPPQSTFWVGTGLVMPAPLESQVVGVTGSVAPIFPESQASKADPSNILPPTQSIEAPPKVSFQEITDLINSMIERGLLTEEGREAQYKECLAWNSSTFESTQRVIGKHPLPASSTPSPSESLPKESMPRDRYMQQPLTKENRQARAESLIQALQQLKLIGSGDIALWHYVDECKQWWDTQFLKMEQLVFGDKDPIKIADYLHQLQEIYSKGTEEEDRSKRIGALLSALIEHQIIRTEDRERQSKKFETWWNVDLKTLEKAVSDLKTNAQDQYRVVDLLNDLNDVADVSKPDLVSLQSVASLVDAGQFPTTVSTFKITNNDTEIVLDDEGIHVNAKDLFINGTSILPESLNLPPRPIVRELTQAGYRIGATQLTNLTKTLLVKTIPEDKLPSTHAFLDSELGGGFVSLLSGWGLTYALPENDRAQKVARELRVNGLTTFGNVAVDELWEAVIAAIHTSVAELPSNVVESSESEIEIPVEVMDPVDEEIELASVSQVEASPC